MVTGRVCHFLQDGIGSKVSAAPDEILCPMYTPNIKCNIIIGFAWQYLIGKVTFYVLTMSLFLRSFINLKEVKLIMLLLKLFVEKHAMCKEKLMRVGIITHYKAQKLCIERALKDEPYKEYKKLLK